MLISIFLMIIISTSLTVPTQPSPRFHVEAWLPFRNCEKDYCQTQAWIFGAEQKLSDGVGEGVICFVLFSFCFHIHALTFEIF